MRVTPEGAMPCGGIRSPMRGHKKSLVGMVNAMSGSRRFGPCTKRLPRSGESANVNLSGVITGRVGPSRSSRDGRPRLGSHRLQAAPEVAGRRAEGTG
jgi:hypothetical protein